MFESMFTEVSDETVRWAPRLFSAGATLALFWVVSWLVRRLVRSVARQMVLEETLRSFALALVRVVMTIIGGVAVLGQLGVDTSSLLASLGIVGLTVGFAAKDVLSNVIAGLFIYWDRPFVLGDLVEIGDHYGNVKEITLRSTRVVTPDGRMLAIPNTTVVESIVASYTNFPHLRVDIAVTIGFDVDLERVRSLFHELIEGDKRFLDTPKPMMVVTALNDYNRAIEFRVWIDDETKHIPIRFELRERIYDALHLANVDMPLETIAVTGLSLVPN